MKVGTPTLIFCNMSNEIARLSMKGGTPKLIFHNMSNEITRKLLMMCGGPPAHLEAQSAYFATSRMK